MSPAPSIAERLRALDVLAHVSDEHIAQLAKCVSRGRYPAGVTVIKQGETTAEAYVIERGGVRIGRETPYGQFALATLGPGDLFGETSFVDGEARSGDATTEVETHLLVLSPVSLATVIERDPRFALALHWAFWKSLSRKLRETNEKLTRFFQESGKPPSTAAARAPRASGEFRIAMADKRSLFQEQKLSTMEIHFLASLSREEKLAHGQVIFREGDVADRMYVVLDGRVMISKYIPGAGEEALAFLERGDWFGEMALIDKTPRSADAKAHEGGAVVLGIPAAVVDNLLDIGKVSSLRLLKILCSLVAKRLREVDDKIIGWYILAGGGGHSLVDDALREQLPSLVELGFGELDEGETDGRPGLAPDLALADDPDEQEPRRRDPRDPDDDEE